jgi:hypothetical protein
MATQKFLEPIFYEVVEPGHKAACAAQRRGLATCGNPPDLSQKAAGCDPLSAPVRPLLM